MKGKVPGLVIAATGVAVIVVVLVARLFTVAPAFERMTTNFRPEMQASTLTQLHADLNGLSAAQQEFTTKGVPQLAAAAHTTPAQFNAVLQSQFPAVSKGMQAVPQVSQRFNAVLTTLGNERSRFAQADAIPTKSTSATWIPWIMVGAALLAVGLLLLVPRRRRGWLAVALGGLLIAGPLMLSLPAKASATDTMNSHLKAVYNAQLISGAKQSLATMQAMGTEIQTKMLPALAQTLQLPPAQLQAFLTANMPSLAAAVANMPASLARFNKLVNTFDRSLKDYNTVKSTALARIVWIQIAAGAVIVAMGVLALAWRNDQPAVVAAIPVHQATRRWHRHATAA